MAYTDELPALIELEQALRRKIAVRIAEEAGAPAGVPSSEQMSAADHAIADWAERGEDDQDLRAFRPIGPLTELLANHATVVERILDIRNRRLS
jgi:hypothetical protein